MFLSTCASTVVHSDTSWLRGVSKTPQYFLSTLSKPSGSSATAFCYALNPSIFDFLLVSLLKCILQQHPCPAPTWLSDISPLTTPKLSGQHWSFLQHQYGFLQEENFSTSLLYTLWRRPEIIIFVKVIEINGRRDYLLAKGHARPAILSVPQPQSWQAWLQINSNSIQEALKCIWNLISSCKILKASHITC